MFFSEVCNANIVGVTREVRYTREVAFGSEVPAGVRSTTFAERTLHFCKSGKYFTAHSRQLHLILLKRSVGYKTYNPKSKIGYGFTLETVYNNYRFAEWRYYREGASGIFYILMALLSSACGSVGMILQKKGCGWMVRKEERPKNAKALFLIWALGMIVAYAFAAVPLIIASKGLAPHIISALSGVNIALTVVLSYFFLKEKLYLSDLFYGLLIVGCIVLLSFHLTDTSGEVNGTYLYPLLAAPLLVLIPLLFKQMSKKHKVALLGVFSGFMMGLSVVMLNILVKQTTAITVEIFSSPYLYFYILVGAASIGAAQLAFKIGDVVLFAPIQIVSNMCYPLICSFFLYSAAVEWLQVVLILLMAFACWGIQRKR